MQAVLTPRRVTRTPADLQRPQRTTSVSTSTPAGNRHGLKHIRIPKHMAHMPRCTRQTTEQHASRTHQDALPVKLF
eukprot:5888597-Pleurochrysis_carterae.AAC.1